MYLFPLIRFAFLLHQLFDFALFPIFSQNKIRNKRTHGMGQQTYTPKKGSYKVLELKITFSRFQILNIYFMLQQKK